MQVSNKTYIQLHTEKYFDSKNNNWNSGRKRLKNFHPCYYHSAVCLFILHPFQQYFSYVGGKEPVLEPFPLHQTTKASPGDQTHAWEFNGLEVIDSYHLTTKAVHYSADNIFLANLKENIFNYIYSQLLLPLMV